MWNGVGNGPGFAWALAPHYHRTGVEEEASVSAFLSPRMWSFFIFLFFRVAMLSGLVLSLFGCLGRGACLESGPGNGEVPWYSPWSWGRRFSSGLWAEIGLVPVKIFRALGSWVV